MVHGSVRIVAARGVTAWESLMRGGVPGLAPRDDRDLTIRPRQNRINARGCCEASSIAAGIVLATPADECGIHRRRQSARSGSHRSKHREQP